MKTIATILVLVCLAGSLVAADFTISGDYLEVRTADVYTGPCFANGEMNLAGKEAILAWRVRRGSWEGIDLDGLSVVAVVKARATLGDPYAEQYPAKAVVVVDEQASAVQESALLSFVKSMAGRLLEDIVWVKGAEIQFELGAMPGHARLTAGDYAEFETRGLHHGDLHCGNEWVYYPPLTDVHASPAYTTVHWFEGQGLDTTWSSPSKRSAFVGTFTR